MKPRICIDLDGTLAEYAGWKGIDKIGDPITGAREFMQTLREHNFGTLMIFTTRVSLVNYRGQNDDNHWRTYIAARVSAIRVWLEKHAIPYDNIWSGVGKPYAKAYIDDRALNATAHIWDPSLPSDCGMCARTLSKLRDLCDA